MRKEPWDSRLGAKMPLFDTFHVFNWDGELCYKLMTDRSYFTFWADPVRKRLYTIDMETEEVYYLEDVFCNF